MSEDKKPFTVSDRRHFTPEGEVRKSDADETAPASPPPPAVSPQGRPSSGEAAGSPPLAAPVPAAPREPEGPATDEPADDEPVAEEGDAGGGRFPSDFLGLLVSLGAQASMLLMGGPDGEAPDLESSRALIELLASLKEKTEGRRTSQEDQLLDGILYELRMAYVQVTKAGGR
jgi:hypothetical protein